MPMLRTVKCDICNTEYTEVTYGSGFPNWMRINGIVLDGNDEVWLCTKHRDIVANEIDTMKSNIGRGNLE